MVVKDTYTETSLETQTSERFLWVKITGTGIWTVDRKRIVKKAGGRVRAENVLSDAVTWVKAIWWGKHIEEGWGHWTHDQEKD